MRLILLIAALVLTPFAAQAREAQRPVTVLVGIDGFRADYIDRGVTPRLAALAKDGATGPMRPSFPTATASRAIR